MSGPLPGAVHDLSAARIWGHRGELADCGLVVLADPAQASLLPWRVGQLAEAIHVLRTGKPEDENSLHLSAYCGRSLMLKNSPRFPVA